MAHLGRVGDGPESAVCGPCFQAAAALRSNMENRSIWSRLGLILNPAQFETGAPSVQIPGKSVVLCFPIDGSTCTLSHLCVAGLQEREYVHTCDSLTGFFLL